MYTYIYVITNIIIFISIISSICVVTMVIMVIYVSSERDPAATKRCGFGEGQLGSALTESLHVFFDTGSFWVLPLTEPTFILPQVTGHTFFPICQTNITFSAVPLVLTPFVHNQ